MKLLRVIHDRMLLLQRRRAIKLVVSIVFALGISAYFLPASIEAYRVDRLEREIVEILATADLAAGDGAAVQFQEEGTVTVGGKEYSDPRLAGIADQFFNAQGEMVAAAEAAVFLVASEMPTWIPTFLLDQPSLTIVFWILTVLWAAAIAWCGMSWTFVLTVFGAFLASIPFWIGTVFFGRAESPPQREVILALCGMAFLAITFALFTRLALLLLSSPRPLFAIAQGVVREAVRLRISVAFIVILVVFLPLIPLWIDGNEPLRHQIQTYLSRSISLTYVLLACMTLILGCATVAFEIRDRQIWQVMTKPVSRFSYLLGKWIGIVVVNAVAISTASLAIFVSVEHLKTRPAQDAMDELAVRTEVLTARASDIPDYPKLSPKQLRDMVNEQIDNDAELRGQIDRGETSLVEIQAALVEEIVSDFSFAQRKIAPGASKKLVFRGLGESKTSGSEARLRYLFHCGASDTHTVHPLIFRFPKTDSWIDVQYVPTVGGFLRIPPQMIEDDGTLEIEMINAGYDQPTDRFYPAQNTVNWDVDDLEVLYKVSDFEWNFIRAILVDWFKLSFLGVLAVATGSFLSFPVACLLSFAVFIGGSVAPFLGVSLDQYHPTNFVEVIISLLAQFVHVLLYRFGAVQPSQMLVEGRLIPWGEVAQEFFWLMIIWAGVALFLGYLAFWRKELAVYSGQG